jgi:hypothetical protein
VQKRLRLAHSIALGGLLIALPTVALSSDSVFDLQLARWGNRALVSIEGPNRQPVTTTVDDHFGPTPYDRPYVSRNAIAAGGIRLRTAGSGTLWVYDPVHHIAAASSRGDLTGDALFYTARPPTAFPRRDLSRTVSTRGLRLGMSIARAATILGVSPDSVKRTSPERSVLYVRKPRKCGTYACAADSTLIFENGRAIAISLYAVGP